MPKAFNMWSRIVYTSQQREISQRISVISVIQRSFMQPPAPSLGWVLLDSASPHCSLDLFAPYLSLPPFSLPSPLSLTASVMEERNLKAVGYLRICFVSWKTEVTLPFCIWIWWCFENFPLYFRMILGWHQSCRESTEFPSTLHPASPKVGSLHKHSS